MTVRRLVAPILALALAGCAEIEGLLPAPRFAGAIADGVTCFGVPVELCRDFAAEVGWREGNPLLRGVAVECVATMGTCSPAEGCARLHLRLSDGSTLMRDMGWEAEPAGVSTSSACDGVEPPAG